MNRGSQRGYDSLVEGGGVAISRPGVGYARHGKAEALWAVGVASPCHRGGENGRAHSRDVASQGVGGALLAGYGEHDDMSEREGVGEVLLGGVGDSVLAAPMRQREEVGVLDWPSGLGRGGACSMIGWCGGGWRRVVVVGREDYLAVGADVLCEIVVVAGQVSCGRSSGRHGR